MLYAYYLAIRISARYFFSWNNKLKYITHNIFIQASRVKWSNISMSHHKSETEAKSRQHYFEEHGEKKSEHI